MIPRSRAELHPYQATAIDFLKTGAARQVIAIMGSGKTAIALHAIADLQRSGELASGPVLVIAPLLIAETVWHSEAERGRTPQVLSSSGFSVHRGGAWPRWIGKPTSMSRTTIICAGSPPRSLNGTGASRCRSPMKAAA